MHGTHGMHGMQGLNSSVGTSSPADGAHSRHAAADGSAHVGLGSLRKPNFGTASWHMAALLDLAGI